MQSDGLSGPLMKVDQSLKNMLTPLVKMMFIPLELIATASALDAGIHKEILGSGTTILIVSGKEIRDAKNSLVSRGL